MGEGNVAAPPAPDFLPPDLMSVITGNMSVRTFTLLDARQLSHRCTQVSNALGRHASKRPHDSALRSVDHDGRR
jgi:hypothetical protein